MTGEIGATSLNIGKKEIPLLFSNRAIAEAERIISKGIIGILNGFSQGQTGIFEVVVLLETGMEAARRYHRVGGKRITREDAYATLDEVGFTNAAGPIFEAIGAVLAYSPEEQEDDDPN